MMSEVKQSKSKMFVFIAIRKNRFMFIYFKKTKIIFSMKIKEISLSKRNNNIFIETERDDIDFFNIKIKIFNI